MERSRAIEAIKRILYHCLPDDPACTIVLELSHETSPIMFRVLVHGILSDIQTDRILKATSNDVDCDVIHARYKGFDYYVWLDCRPLAVLATDADLVSV